MRLPILILALTLSAAAQAHKVGVDRFTLPHYPPIARQARVQGDVVLDLKLDAQGEISALTVVSGHPMLKPAALDAMKTWRFICLDCKPGESFDHRITISFLLDVPGDCKLTVARSVLDFPKRITVEYGPVCIEVTTTYTAALH